ncbi:DDE family transposase [Salegentibacter sp. 24]|uniref:IS1380 family transposase n=1 Tax=Salegentibacter sp. 24 TaxID=2183986 RepID=UPI0010622AC0|nr:IS1380 family transposase [Salegentibacter sp. 24]TDN95074.1 DDE family transposase [Salegentibacter sp. 24]TDN95079.1 DDE family transposase [Salegentibacter sp. 24]
MKITTSLENIQSFGGLNFVSAEFDQLNLPEMIARHLGQRPSQAKFSYSDMVRNMWSVLFSGGDCAEDLQTNLKNEFLHIQDLNVCSPDTVLRLQKSLALGKEIHIGKSGSVNEFSKHPKLNALNLDLLLQSKTLCPNQSYDLDFDHQFIPCEKYDSKKGYKMKQGYFPGVASIGKHIVYVENRNGNSNVKFKQAETLQDTYDLLKSQNIQIDRSRMDCGSFTKEIIKTVQANSERFYIRAQRCGELSNKIKNVQQWQTVKIGLFDVEVCSIEYTPFGGKKTYRYVISREKNHTGQTDAFFGDAFTYRAIATNDLASTDKEIIEYYNQRGTSERIFDQMNNDFGWKNLPFSFLEENTVYMILTAMCRNFYLMLLEKLSKKIPFVKPYFRLKKFIFRFVTVPFKWIRRARQRILKLFTKKPYHLLV